uniref:FYVE-type domain-containing protein n=1 Tax=Globodera pallida TaxID=36090 RepID=A0A183CDT7_GLOPA
MQSFWRLINKPRIDDWSPLAKFYYADDSLNAIANELDSFDGRRDPERCNQLVNKLRQAQDRVLHIISEMLMLIFPHESDRASRDFRVKFPDEIMHDNLPGQLWFGAECLAAGSNIVDHEAESEAIRPMAKAFTRHLEKLRDLLKEQALKDPTHYPDGIKGSLKVFDQLFAEFEFAYVSAMVPVKSAKEYDRQLDVAVLFSECLTRVAYITREQIDDCDPNVIISLPRLAIVWGLLLYPGGALNVDVPKEEISEMFRHFYKVLILVRNLLQTLEPSELFKLEKKLVGDHGGFDETCSSVRALEQQIVSSTETNKKNDNSVDRLAYGSSENLIHRLFVCIASIADQLQSNYSADIRKVLKMVLQPIEAVPIYEVSGKAAPVPENEEETGIEVRESLPLPAFVGVRWVPDSDCDQCTSCLSPFTLVRRRHHCRNCGRIFCGQCSTNQIAIPELGYDRRVRVCELCHENRLRQYHSESGHRENASFGEENATTNVMAENEPTAVHWFDCNELPSSSYSHSDIVPCHRLNNGGDDLSAISPQSET